MLESLLLCVICACMAALLYMLVPVFLNDGDTSKNSAAVYPAARRGRRFRLRCFQFFPDPYRWLESYSEETTTWLQQQSELTETFLSAIPARDQLLERLTADHKYERTTPAIVAGKRTFFLKNSGLQEHDVLYVIDAPGEPARVLLDPNQFDAKRQPALAFFNVSRDGEHIAYALSEQGSTLHMLGRILNVTTGNQLREFSMSARGGEAFAWAPDNSGLYYISRTRVYFVAVGKTSGTNGEALKCYFPHRPVPTEDGRYLVVEAGTMQGWNTRVWCKDLQTGKADLIIPLDSNQSMWDFVGSDGTTFFLRTNLGAPRGRLVSIDISKGTFAVKQLSEIIAEPADQRTVLKEVRLVGNRFFAIYMQDVSHQVVEYDLQGRLVRRIQMPDACLVSGFEGAPGDTETYYAVETFTSRPAAYRYDITSGISTLIAPAAQTVADWSKYTTELVFAEAADGSRLPIYLTYKKGMRRDGKNPTYLYGYGGFGIPLVPNFSISRAALLDMGFIYAHAILRGGGEYGEDWHRAGKGCGKQTVFDDFIACARFLISEGYTSPARLAIVGGSNGGLLVGACMTQHPELFAAAVPCSGVLDMVFEDASWEYGSTLGREFWCRYAYSPYHRLSKGVHYPATFVQTGDCDDNVSACQSYKFVAALQWATGSDNPCLLRVEKFGGHHYSLLPLSRRLQRYADEYAFLVKALKLDENPLSSQG